MAAIANTPSRRSFLRGFAALSAAAIPVVSQAQTLDEWDRVSAGLAIIYPRAPEALAHAKAAGMKIGQMTTVLTVIDADLYGGKWPCLIFYDDAGKCHSFRPKGCDPE